MNTATLENRHLKRVLEWGNQTLRTSGFYAENGADSLIQTTGQAEASVTINGHSYNIGTPDHSGFRVCSTEIQTVVGGQSLVITCGEVPSLPGVSVQVIFMAYDAAPVLTKHLLIQNHGQESIRLNHIQVEVIQPLKDKDRKLLVEDDYVRDGITVKGNRVYSPWIEGHKDYIKTFLNSFEDEVRFSYPVEMDWVLEPDSSFESFRAFEFIVPNTTAEAAGLAVRKATRTLFPWTRAQSLGCSLAPANDVRDYYAGIDRISEAGFELVHLNHGWIKGEMTSPLFTNYSDYELRPELFPNGWSDVKKLTDYAHAKGLKISFYSIYVNTWIEEGACTPKAYTDHDWELIWAEDDDSSRWGTTLDPASGWGEVLNRMLSEAITQGGFDTWHLDGPYYGDISVAENRAVKPGGPNQVLAWKHQTEFYQTMRDAGIHGEAAQGFQAFAHGMSRITTTGYEEGDFGDKSIRQQILSNRKAAYSFTMLYRAEQATTVLPVVAWSPDENAPDLLVPMEAHAEEYNAYLANIYGYGFEGKPFCRVPFEGPKSLAAVQRWLNFWKAHRDYFKEGYMLHLYEPDGAHIDAVVHLLDNGPQRRALVVAFNPAEIMLERVCNLILPSFNAAESSWNYRSESGEEGTMTDGMIPISVPAFDATWFELIEIKENKTNA
ncbi:MAG: hypothetical protein H8E75_09360 [Puniceicoccaceae bacterium]|nr:hypothetical protein [Puniceicoccaceae bacterium]